MAVAFGLNLSSDEERRSSSRFRPGKQTDAGNAATPVRILLIEDNEGDAFLVAEALKENGVQAELKVIRDGEEAFAFIDAADYGLEQSPDLVVLDLNLPKKSGHEILAKMREGGAFREVPVVILSSSAVVSETENSKRLGVVRHLQKPSNLEEFMRIGAVLKALLASGIT
jgi:two-component system, chemotaxis family, response regulator Rcp1